MDNTFQQKLQNITMVIFDVDGVFTDGSVYVDSDGNEMMKFSRLDGMGIFLLRQKGVVTVAISREKTGITVARMKKIGVDEIIVGEKNKIDKYNELKEKHNFSDDQIAVCGDDIQDIEMLKSAGLALCPSNAQEEVKKVCDFVSERSGGEHFVREVCNMLIEV